MNGVSIARLPTPAIVIDYVHFVNQFGLIDQSIFQKFSQG